MKLSYLLLTVVLFGCGPANVQHPYLSNLAQAGNVQPFVIIIQNNTQWNLDLGIATNVATGQTGHLIIPSGSDATWSIGFLPSSVTVEAVSTSVPAVVYPSQTQTFGVDYGPTATAISFGFP